MSYLAFATSTAPLSSVWDVRYVTGFRVLQLTTGPPDLSVDSLLSKLYYGLTAHAASRPRFIWNHIPLVNLTQIFGDALTPFTRPVVAGFIGEIKTAAYSLLLISRRSPVRAGVRLWLRGADADGSVANYVETEQVLQMRGGALFSYVQVRGSIPLIWSQYPNFARLPSVGTRSRLAAAYGPLFVVSMTDDRGREKAITAMYNRLCREFVGVRFEDFDFHRECARLHWENIDRLIARIADGLDWIGSDRIHDN
jgi:hypothetical protein